MPGIDDGSDSSGIDVDALLESIDAVRNEIPMEAAAADSTPVPDPARLAQPADSGQNAPAPRGDAAPAKTWRFRASGRDVEATEADLVKYAQQGYDYSTRMAEINKLRTDYDAARKEIDALQPYRQYHEYGQSHPEWVNHLQQSWIARDKVLSGSSADSADPALQPLREELTALRSEIGAVRSHLAERQKEAEANRKAAEDQALATEVRSVMDRYNFMDWTATDQDGKRLEDRVLAYGVEKGLPSFEQAFLLLNHEQLLARAEQQGMEKAVKGNQAQARRGIIGVSMNPMKELKPASDLKSKSYDEILNESLEEIRAGAFG